MRCRSRNERPARGAGLRGPAIRPTASSSVWRRSRCSPHSAEEQPCCVSSTTCSGSTKPRGRCSGSSARRLLAEKVAIVFAVREPSDDRHVAGLPRAAAGRARPQRRASAAGDGRARPARRARPRADHRREPRQSAGPVRAAAGHERGRAGGRLRSARPDHTLGHRGGVPDGGCAALPADTRRLLQLAAADPVGDPVLVWRAAEAARPRSARRDAGGRRRAAGDRRSGAVPSPMHAIGGVPVGVAGRAP